MRQKTSIKDDQFIMILQTICSQMLILTAARTHAYGKSHAHKNLQEFGNSIRVGTHHTSTSKPLLKIGRGILRFWIFVAVIFFICIMSLSSSQY